MPHSTDLDTRSGLSEELLFLLRQYPRDTWHRHPNLEGMARFWLDRHNGFRQLGSALEDALRRFREGGMAPAAFGRFFAPRLQHFLSELHHHHVIEDQHYFPVFVAAEQRLTRGFEVLEGDHEAIHERIEQVIVSANGLLGHLQGTDRDAIRQAADTYAGDSIRLIGGLMRHLDDEEDLIIPLILERGEGPLGIG